MKILIVSEMSVPYAVGGGEVRYALLARELARRGHDVTWLSMRQRQSPDEEMIDGVRHLHRGPRIHNPPSRPLFAMLRYMVTAFWHVLTHRYDVIDCQPYAPLPAVWLACVLSRQRMVATIHDTSSRPASATPAQAGQFGGDDDQWLSARDRLIVGPIETLLYRLPYRRIVTDTFGVRRTLAKSFGVSDRRMVTVHCGIDTEAIAAAPAAASAAAPAGKEIKSETDITAEEKTTTTTAAGGEEEIDEFLSADSKTDKKGKTTTTEELEIKVDDSNAAGAAAPKAKEPSYLPHPVNEAGVTFSKLSEMYGVKIEKLKEANPGLPADKELPIGTKVRIPEE